MGHRTMIDGTAYGVSGGKTMVDGTAYGIAKGRTLVDGTGYDVPFGVTVSIVQNLSTNSKVNQNYISYLTINGTSYRTSQTLEVPAGTEITVYAYFAAHPLSGVFMGAISRNGSYIYHAQNDAKLGWCSYTFSADNDLEIRLTTSYSNATYGSVDITDL